MSYFLAFAAQIYRLIVRMPTTRHTDLACCPRARPLCQLRRTRHLAGVSTVTTISVSRLGVPQGHTTRCTRSSTSLLKESPNVPRRLLLSTKSEVSPSSLLLSRLWTTSPSRVIGECYAFNSVFGIYVSYLSHLFPRASHYADVCDALTPISALPSVLSWAPRAFSNTNAVSFVHQRVSTSS